VFLIAQVTGHLLGQRPLQHRLGHLDSRPSGPSSSTPLLPPCPAVHRPAPHRPAAGGLENRPRICGAPSQCLTSRVLPRPPPAAHRETTSLTQLVRHAPRCGPIRRVVR
jgi:hypothetical protein